MIDHITPFGALVLVLILFVCYFGVPIVIGLVSFLLFRVLKKANQTKIQERSGKEEVRCLGCGAVIDANLQACQKCGWTWR